MIFVSKCQKRNIILVVSKLLLPINVCKKSYSTSSSQPPFKNYFELEIVRFFVLNYINKTFTYSIIII